MLAHDVKLSNASPELVTEYINRIERLKTDACSNAMDLVELSIRFALSKPGVSTLALSLADRSHVDQAIHAASKGPLPTDLFDRVMRNHVWVKNFYYFSQNTVDGNSAKLI